MSDYNEIRDARTRVNNCVIFPDTAQDFPHCTICLEHWRLRVSVNADGVKVGYCHGCGTTFQLESNEVIPRQVVKYGALIYAAGVD